MMLMVGVILGMSGCEDRFGISHSPVSEEELVDVSLVIGIADRVDASAENHSSSTKAQSIVGSNKSAFDVRLVSATQTKGDGSRSDALAVALPDKLYNLQILQYDSNNTFKALTSNIAQQEIGSILAVSLVPCDNCQLIIVARGSSEAIPVFSGTPTWSDLQGKLADYNSINDLVDINDMPYFIHLTNVNITNEGKVIQSANGKDARVLLKRLAARLTVNWSFNVDMQKNYTLKEVKLCQVPSAYYLMPQTESDSRFEGNLYPISLIEYKDIYRLKGTDAPVQGSLTTWIPANAKGKSNQVTSIYYRTKEYAHSAATYMEFVVDNKEESERLFYRAYLGGKEVSDFNLLENTNYNWTINIQNADYRSDPRIQLLDQAPVISPNLVPTSNCFMMRPGTNICFNPYKHEAGTDNWNTYATTDGSIGSGKTIDQVKVIWQTKDAGTTGDLVMGYVIGETNHKNLVNLTGSGKDDTRVHVKAPNTKGGNALIAGYHTNDDGTQTVVWSWHLWITDYVPQGITSTITYEDAQRLTQGGSVHQYSAASAFRSGGIYEKKVIMDRNLCATAGGFPGIGASKLEFGKRIGYLYAWGRKDPFFGSVDGSDKEINIIYDGDGYPISLPTDSYSDDKLVDGNMMQWTIQHPDVFLKGKLGWYNGSENNDAYQYLWKDQAGKKTIYDPCPAGWRIPDKAIGEGWSTSNAYWYNENGGFVANGTYHDQGGRLYNVSGNSGVPAPQTIHNTAWFPVTTYRAYSTGILSRAKAGYLGTGTIAWNGSNFRIYYSKYSQSSMGGMGNAYGYIGEPYPFRCVQSN